MLPICPCSCSCFSVWQVARPPELDDEELVEPDDDEDEELDEPDDDEDEDELDELELDEDCAAGAGLLSSLEHATTTRSDRAAEHQAKDFMIR